MKGRKRTLIWNLLPTELYSYSLGDLIRGLRAVGPGHPISSSTEPFPVAEGIPIRSGRAGLVLSIKALGLAAGSRIGVPLYCCPVVFKSIQAAGCRPRFLDIDPGTFCLSPEDLDAKRSELDAVIAVHMFGNVCDMGRIGEAMGEKPVIEDCAQAIGSTLNGRRAGSMGAIGVFSFRLGKYLSAGEGAVICANRPGLREALARASAALAKPGWSEELKHLFETLARAKLRSRPLWGLLGSPLWSLYNRKTDFVDKSPIVMAQAFRSDLEIARHRLTRLPQMIRSQRENADYYIDTLRLDRSRFCLERPGTFYDRLMFPIVLDDMGQRDLLRALLKERGIGSATPYEDVAEGAALHYGYGGDCPVAERLLKTTLVVPCHYKLRKRDVARIARGVNEAWDDLPRA